MIRSSKDVANALNATLGTPGLLLVEEELGPEFFDLRTGLAGELFQKFINYKQRIALVIARPEKYGERFAELAREHRTHNMIRFFSTVEEAGAWLESGVSR